jgi:peptidyl-prolyl cis-trans isomerase A (cyclophilin A)
MLRLALILLAPLLIAGAALAQPVEPKPPVKVALTTPLGVVTLALDVEKAPITAGNFLRYVDQRRYDGASFYRASKTPETVGEGLVQGGLQNDPKKILKPIAHEPTTKTGLSHVNGAISMGRWAPGTATSDFFLILGEQTYLDADPKDPANPGFAVFGKVVDGLDVARAILAQPTSPTAGVGVMKGEMLEPPVKILTARRVD